MLYCIYAAFAIRYWTTLEHKDGKLKTWAFSYFFWLLNVYVRGIKLPELNQTISYLLMTSIVNVCTWNHRTFYDEICFGSIYNISHSFANLRQSKWSVLYWNLVLRLFRVTVFVWGWQERLLWQCHRLCSIQFCRDCGVIWRPYLTLLSTEFLLPACHPSNANCRILNSWFLGEVQH